MAPYTVTDMTTIVEAMLHTSLNTYCEGWGDQIFTSQYVSQYTYLVSDPERVIEFKPFMSMTPCTNYLTFTYQVELVDPLGTSTINIATLPLPAFITYLSDTKIKLSPTTLKGTYELLITGTSQYNDKQSTIITIVVEGNLGPPAFLKPLSRIEAPTNEITKYSLPTISDPD